MTIIVNLTPSQTNIPIEDLRMNLDGLSCRYQRAGSGPALLLVHGLMGYSFSWRYTIPALAHQATVYALDLPGTGFSDRSADMDCGQAASAKRLLSFMDQAGIASCDLLGTSHGGALGDDGSCTGATARAAIDPGCARQPLVRLRSLPDSFPQ